MKKIPILITQIAWLFLATEAQSRPAEPVSSSAIAASAGPRLPADGQASVNPGNPLYRVFLERHSAFLRRGRESPIGLLFIGDSITEGWRIAPAIWRKYYGKFEPANFGIGGDTTQGVLWRIGHGELDGIHPRVVVLLLGTNNVSQDYPAGEIAAADRKIVGIILEKLPESKVLVLGVFPRGAHRSSDGSIDDADKRMAVIRPLNRELAKLEDGARVRYLDIGDRFLGRDGKIPDAIMGDQLHPTLAGYQIWADAMQPLLEEMMR